MRELWVDEQYRNQQWGTKLMEAVYIVFKDNGVNKVLLTYDEEAIGFYDKLGYKEDSSYQAKNQQKCITKMLE